MCAGGAWIRAWAPDSRAETGSPGALQDLGQVHLLRKVFGSGPSTFEWRWAERQAHKELRTAHQPGEALPFTVSRFWASPPWPWVCMVSLRDQGDWGEGSGSLKRCRTHLSSSLMPPPPSIRPWWRECSVGQHAALPGSLPIGWRLRHPIYLFSKCLLKTQGH